mmetsp:Transcript_17261/g.21201  ORF Transcript_17261/g.21201 Transcript_17261/m.21201 type:complete len:405 (+) Transcript_17261:726-1940(+)
MGHLNSTLRWDTNTATYKWGPSVQAASGWRNRSSRTNINGAQDTRPRLRPVASITTALTNLTLMLNPRRSRQGGSASNSPELYEDAHEGKWPRLLSRCVTHPKEAFYNDKFHNTALHLACRRQPPVEVIRALIRAHPGSASSRTVDGLTPLHFLCYCGGSVSAIQELISSYPKAPSIRDRKGRTPLHCVSAGFRTKERAEIVKSLLMRDLGTATAENEKGRTSPSLIFEDYAKEIERGEVLITQIRPKTGNNDASVGSVSIGSEFDVDETLGECWESTSLLIRAAYYGNLNSTDEEHPHVVRMVHAALGVRGCPPKFVQMVLKLYPQQVTEIDGAGRLPLYITCRTRPVNDEFLENANLFTFAERSLKSGGVPTSAASKDGEHRPSSIINRLLHLHKFSTRSEA